MRDSKGSREVNNDCCPCLSQISCLECVGMKQGTKSKEKCLLVQKESNSSQYHARVIKLLCVIITSS